MYIFLFVQNICSDDVDAAFLPVTILKHLSNVIIKALVYLTSVFNMANKTDWFTLRPQATLLIPSHFLSVQFSMQPQKKPTADPPEILHLNPQNTAHKNIHL